MIMKTLKYSVKLSSVIFTLLICTVLYSKQEDPDSIPAFIQSDEVKEANEAVEAYQTENSPEIEAYLTDIQFFDQR